jgi:very-short-patch-repair endonuclease
VSALEDLLLLQLRQQRLPLPEREYRFHETRKWRFDFAWPDRMLAVEVEGGTWVKGAHSRGKHYESDCIKYNTAALLGWRVLRFTTDMVRDGRAHATVREAMMVPITLGHLS